MSFLPQALVPKSRKARRETGQSGPAVQQTAQKQANTRGGTR